MSKQERLNFHAEIKANRKAENRKYNIALLYLITIISICIICLIKIL